MSWIVDVHKCEIPSEEEVAQHERESVWKCSLCDSRWFITFDSQAAKLKLQRMDWKSLKDAQGWTSGSMASGESVDSTLKDLGKLAKAGGTVTGRLSYNEPAFEDFPLDPVEFGKTTKYGNEITDERTD